MYDTVTVEYAAKLVLSTKKEWERSFSGTREEEDAAYAKHMQAIQVYGQAIKWAADDAREATKNALAEGESLARVAPVCPGHESTNGPAGIAVYCDGSCRS